MDACLAAAADTKQTLGKVRTDTIEQKMRTQEFAATLSIVQDLDSNKPEAFPKLYAFKREDIDSEITMAKEQAN